MDDLISRQAALESQIKMVAEGLDWIPAFYIEQLPSAERRGRWDCDDVISHEGHFEGYFCSECGKGFLDDLCENNGADFINAYNEFKFCPFCGAKMDGDTE